MKIRLSFYDFGKYILDAYPNIFVMLSKTKFSNLANFLKRAILYDTGQMCGRKKTLLLSDQRLLDAFACPKFLRMLLES